MNGGKPAASSTPTGSIAPTPRRDVRAKWGDLPAGTETDAKVAVAGRVLLKRDAGKLVFATITDRGVGLQLFIARA